MQLVFISMIYKIGFDSPPTIQSWIGMSIELYPSLVEMQPFIRAYTSSYISSNDYSLVELEMQ